MISAWWLVPTFFIGAILGVFFIGIYSGGKK